MTLANFPGSGCRNGMLFDNFHVAAHGETGSARVHLY
jgi:hypothetical protein